MKTLLPVILILIAILTVGIAGDWIVDNVSISNRLNQITATATNTVMGALGIGTADPEAQLHVVGPTRLEGRLNMESNRVVNLARAVDDGDAVSKAYIDNALANVPARGGIAMGVYTNR